MSEAAVDRSRAFALGDGRTAVPEPDVKAALRRLGVATPAAVAIEAGNVGSSDVTAFAGPLVVKAFGGGIVHKTDVGAVRLGVAPRELPDAMARMSAVLAGHGLAPAGFLVEEQCERAGGVELLAGVVRREPFGLVVALGLGGTLAEAFRQVAARLFPLSAADARDLIAEIPGAPALTADRGRTPIDHDALVAFLLALAGADGLAARLGDELDELECNPVLATGDAAVALDARLVLRTMPGNARASAELGPTVTDFTRMFAPRAVAVAGASSRGGGFGNRALAAYRAFGWDEHLFALHPTATAIDGVPAVAGIAELTEPVDYLLVAVHAEQCAPLVRATAGHVPFVHVISGGFEEVGPAGLARGRDLLDAARAVGTRLVGPNCIGVYCPAGRQTFQLHAPRDAGSVSVVSQSGGLAGDIVIAGAARGLRFAKVLSAGNAIDVAPAEVAAWLLDDPETAVIGLYLEGSSGAAGLVDVLRQARGVKPVVLLVGGQSDQGAAAVVSHTGSLTPEPRLWDALASSTSCTTVHTLEHFLAALTYLQRWSGTAGKTTAGTPGHVIVVGPGGGASVLATDACDRAGLVLPPTTPAVRDQLEAIGLGAGTSVANPLEIPFGPAAPVDALRGVLTPVLAHQSVPDVLVHVNVAAYYGYGTEGLRPLAAQLGDLAVAPIGDARIGVVLRNLGVATPADAHLIASAADHLGLVTFADLDEAAIAIAATSRFDRERRRLAPSGLTP